MGENEKFTVLSLGWGVQSFTLAARVALGDLPPIDAAIHSDTTYERSATYKFAERWTPWLEEHGVHVVTVWDKWAARGLLGDVAQHAQFYTVLNTTGHDGYVSVPAFTDSKKGGQLHRSCTQRWKIAPMRRWIQKNRGSRYVEQWIGISLDEIERMKPSGVGYITNRFPLIENRISRANCSAWLLEHNLDVPPKSSCTICPYHSKRAWYDMKNEGGTDWNEALKVDRVIRKARPPYDLYLHYERVPIEEISTPEENGQLSMFESAECSGMCFI